MKTLAKILTVVLIASVLMIGSAVAEPYYRMSAGWTNIVYNQYGDPHVTTQDILDTHRGLLQSRLVWGECYPDYNCTNCGTSFLIFESAMGYYNLPYIMDNIIYGLWSMNEGESREYLIGRLSYVKGYPSRAEAGIQADLEISIESWGGMTYQLKTIPSVIHFNLKPNGSGGEVISSKITSSFMGYIYSEDLKQRSLRIKVELIYNTAQPIDDIGDMKMKFTAILRPSGDLNGDWDVDMNDLNIIKANLNKFASACPECDLDNDGKITVLDAKKLMNMCSCPKCVCP